MNKESSTDWVTGALQDFSAVKSKYPKIGTSKKKSVLHFLDCLAVGFLLPRLRMSILLEEIEPTRFEWLGRNRDYRILKYVVTKRHYGQMD